MNTGKHLSLAIAGISIAGPVIAITISQISPAHAEPGTKSDSRVEIGFAIAPVPLNMAGKNPARVGLGSYIVNTEGCNDCHDAGPPTEYSAPNNPYWGNAKKVNPAYYLGGGRDFGPLIPGSYDIVSRNITPDKTGLPAGLAFDDFVAAIRMGIDDDHLHPPCPTGTVATNCIPAPFDGNLLQVMPWPNFKNWTDNDLKSVYEYLSAVPCVEGHYPGDAKNRCG